MATRAEPSAEPRTPLSKERVLRAAVDLADKGGIESLSMRKLAQELGVEAMSLYNHVRNKDDILDGVVDVVVGEIQIPPETSEWKTSLRQTVLSARGVLLRHRGRTRHESRKKPSPANFSIRVGDRDPPQGGFRRPDPSRATRRLGSRVLGFPRSFQRLGRARFRPGRRRHVREMARSSIMSRWPWPSARGRPRGFDDVESRSLLTDPGGLEGGVLTPLTRPESVADQRARRMSFPSSGPMRSRESAIGL